MVNNLLTCKICNAYSAKQLHQHLKKIHNVNSTEYRLLYGEESVMQIGFDPIKKIIITTRSKYVKKGYIKLHKQLELIEPYTKLELRAALIDNNLWKKYLGKSKYRTMIVDDIKLYKSIQLYITIDATLENKIKSIVEYNYNVELARCSCGKKYTFGKNCGS